ncbi:MAG TPA: prolyl oligopeptidase family serine peptidase [Ilumatobacteraceae bacterium]|nr:prolyl oligopeptidase family serine peptidase [Ilumatobacteraceae bacterium]
MEIPVDLVLSGRDLTEPKLSPDGRRVAFVERWRGASAILVVDLDVPEPARAIVFGPDPAPGRGMGGGCYSWMADSTGVVYAAVDGELWSASGLDLHRVTSHERSARAPWACGRFVVYVLDEAEVWLTDFDTGDSRRLDDGRHEFCFDPSVSPDATVVSWQGWSPPAMPWDAAERVNCRHPLAAADLSTWRPALGAVQQPRFAPDGTPTCVHDGSGWLNVQYGDRAVVVEQVEHAGPTWGMGQRSFVVRHDGSCIVARNCAGFGTLSIIDPVGGVRDLLTDGPSASSGTAVYGQLSMVDDRLVAVRSGPTTPPEIVLVDLAAPERPARVVAASGVAAWRDVVLAEPEAIAVEHDGIVLHARRYAVGEGRLLCWVHGGPTDQWQVDFRPRVAYWCSRGWDVLVADPRGTTGHGRAYQQALNGKWGRLDVDDTAALIRRAHAQGWATPATTVVIGGSSGGLTVLGLLADHGDLVAGGVASYPVSDLVGLADATHRFEAHYNDTLVGMRGEPGLNDRYRSLSPINRAGRIVSPLLVFHGTADAVVPIAHSVTLADRISSSGGDVELVVYDGEGHGFGDPTNQRDEYARTERFLRRFRGTD